MPMFAQPGELEKLRRENDSLKAIIEMEGLTRIDTEFKIKSTSVKRDDSKSAGLHMYGGLWVQEFNKDYLNFELDLTYNFGKLFVGVVAMTYSDNKGGGKHNMEILYGPIVRFKIF